LERLGLDVIEVIDAAATKWNFNKYYPGAGVGGHCLPKDPYYLVKTAEKHGYHAQVITAGRKINDSMPHHVFELLVHGLNKSGKAVKSSKVVVLGVSYKENVGDTRKAPTLKLLEDLRRKEAHIVTVDAYVPAYVVEKEFLVPKKDHHGDLWSAVSGADAIVLMTGHHEFIDMDLKKLRSVVKDGCVFVDGRRLYKPDAIKAAGFIYQGIGAGRDN